MLNVITVYINIITTMRKALQNIDKLLFCSNGYCDHCIKDQINKIIFKKLTISQLNNTRNKNNSM